MMAIILLTDTQIEMDLEIDIERHLFLLFLSIFSLFFFWLDSYILKPKRIYN